jgi:predicted GNAT family N-acyltransferase
MIQIQPAKTKELLDHVHNIRRTVFVIEQGCPEDIEWEYEDESHHYLALYNNAPAGTARWRETANGIKLERFAVLKEFRNKEIGKALLLHILNETNPFLKKRYLHSQLSAKNFYLKNGLTPVGDHFWEADIEHVKMEF